MLRSLRIWLLVIGGLQCTEGVGKQGVLSQNTTHASLLSIHTKLSRDAADGTAINYSMQKRRKLPVGPWDIVQYNLPNKSEGYVKSLMMELAETMRIMAGKSDSVTQHAESRFDPIKTLDDVDSISKMTVDISSFEKKLHSVRRAPYTDFVNSQVPFWLFHVAKTGGSTMRAALAKAFQNQSISVQYPCETCSCTCHIFEEAAAFKQFTCAQAFLGHFSPSKDIPQLLLNEAGIIVHKNSSIDLADAPRCHRYSRNKGQRLSSVAISALISVSSALTQGLQQGQSMNAILQVGTMALMKRSLCTFALRDPRTRIVSHWYEFAFKKTGISITDYYKQFGANDLFRQTGGLMYGDIVFGNSMNISEAAFEHCIVGTQEAYSNYMYTLARFVPALEIDKAHAHEHHNSRVGVNEETLSTFLKEVEPMMAVDIALWEKATEVSARQHSLAMRVPALERGIGA